MDTRKRTIRVIRRTNARRRLVRWKTSRLRRGVLNDYPRIVRLSPTLRSALRREGWAVPS